nr:helix-turn-helix domain-containing protein [Paraburkholderia panacisoli]
MRVHKIRLDPTAEQAKYFARACGVARFAYNWALAEWKRQYEAGAKPNEAALRKQLNAIKAVEFPWMAEVTKCAPQVAIMNVGLAFDHFFRRVKLGQKPGYPRFKRKLVPRRQWARERVQSRRAGARQDRETPALRRRSHARGIALCWPRAGRDCEPHGRWMVCGAGRGD